MKNTTFTKEFLATNGYYAFSDRTFTFYRYDPNVTYEDLKKMPTTELLDRLEELAVYYSEVTADHLDGSITTEEACEEACKTSNRMSDIRVQIRWRILYGENESVA